MRISIKYASHLPVLTKIVENTNGPILELGIGVYSTTYLHWACFPKKRRLTSYDNTEKWTHYFRDCRSDFHDIKFIDDWDKLAIDQFWDIVLIDHDPSNQRGITARKFANSAKYIILHDSEPESDSTYGYSEIYPLFKYRFNYTLYKKAHTTVLSNFVDLKHLNDAVMIKLNLGCKRRKLPGFDNLDKIYGWLFQDGLPQYADSTVDGITISHALCFLTIPELETFAKEMRRVLKVEGVVRITEDDTENPLSVTYQTGCVASGPRCLTGPKMMREMLEKVGFTVYDVDRTTTYFDNASLMQAYRGGPPKYFFIEGVKNQ